MKIMVAGYLLKLALPRDKFNIMSYFRHSKWIVRITGVYLLALISFGASAKSTQGQVGNFNECRRTGHPIYVMACFSYVLDYKFDTLAGEPTKNFGLRWKLNSLRTRSPATGEENTRFMAEWPKAFSDGLNKLTLSLNGDLTIVASGNKGDEMWISWDSGASTVQDKTSWNVPSSPNWAEFIKERVGLMFHCDETVKPVYASESAAKEMANAGIKVRNSRYLCKPNFSGWEALDKATASYCGTAKRDGKGRDAMGLCEIQEDEKKRPEAGKMDSNTDFFESAVAPNNNAHPSSRPDILDEFAENKLISAETEKQRSSFQRQAESACSNAIQAVQSCRLTNQCKSANQIQADVQICQKAACGLAPKERLFENYSCGNYGDERNQERKSGTLLLPRVCSRDAGPNPKYSEWQQCAEQQSQCKPQPDTCEIRCNPEGYVSESHCVTKKMAGAPSAAKVGDTLRKQWSKSGKSKPPAKDFLD